MERVEGTAEKGYGRVAKVLAEQLEQTHGGAAVCVYHNGRKVVDVWGGKRDRAGRPWEQDTLSISFSTTKGVTATLLHMMVDRGLLHYDDPVAKHWPEFAEGGKDEITVRHLLTHTANLYDVRNLIEHADQMSDWDEMTRLLAQCTPPRGPTKSSTYHAMTYGWLVGEVIRRVAGDGRSFAQIVQDELAQPLALDGLFVGVPDEHHHRVAELLMGGDPFGQKKSGDTKKKAGRAQKMMKRAQQGLKLAERVGIKYDTRSFADAMMAPGFNPRSLNKPESMRASMPAVNGTFTARSLAKMYAALAQGGQIDGVRIVSDETLQEATRHHIKSVDRVIPVPMNWRLGYHQPFVLARRPPRSFGHFGFGGSGGWACPERNLAVAFTCNSGTGSPWGDLRIMQLGRAALKAADRAG